MKNKNNILVILSLSVATIGLHGSALYGYWRFDDPVLLLNAIDYFPQQYFFIPEITAAVSGNQICPWNVFVYDINLKLFGLKPFWFYLHHLISIWLVAAGTYFLLHLWLRSPQALSGAILFLIGSPVFHIAQQLMTGHYIYGLLFSIMTLYTYILSLRKNSSGLAVLSSFFYLLAISCKEIYVPLVLVLPLISEDVSLKRRLSYLIPFIAIDILYILWRFMALGELFGSYIRPAPFKIDVFIKSLFSIPHALLGNTLFSWFGIVCLSLLVIMSIHKKKANIMILSASLFSLIMPLYPVMSNNMSWVQSNRYLFAVWWSLCILVALSTSNYYSDKRWKPEYRFPSRVIYLLFIFIIAVNVIMQSVKQVRYDKKINQLMDAHYKVVSTAKPPMLVYPEMNFGFPGAIIIWSSFLKEVNEHYNHEKRYWPFQLRNPRKDEFDNLYVWDDDCNCMQSFALLPDFKKEKLLNELNHIMEPRVYFYNFTPTRIIKHKNGYVDSIILKENIIEISGWVYAMDSMYKSLYVVTPVPPRGSSLRIHERQDIALSSGVRDFPNSGFSLSMEFNSRSEAVGSLSQLCILSLGFTAPERVEISLMDGLSGYCDRWLKRI